MSDGQKKKKKNGEEMGRGEEETTAEEKGKKRCLQLLERCSSTRQTNAHVLPPLRLNAGRALLTG